MVWMIVGPTVSVNPFVAFYSDHGNWNIKSASLICTVAHTMKQTTLILSHLSPIYLMSCVFTVHITFINFDKHSPDLGRYTCLAPERFKRSICGPRPKKVVHHWSRVMTCSGSQSRPRLDIGSCS